ncbi:MAG TPA: DNA repair protein RecO [Tepidisphaeraceae bacterium]|jgi:DNA repair protein RecO (recombination protein O)
MPLSRDRAICLRKFEYSETSQILTLFCRRTGLIRVMAKGSHRRTKAGSSKFDGGLDLLDAGDCVFIEHSGRDLSTLTEWKLLDGHLGLRASLPAILLGQALAEVLSAMLPEHDPHPNLFDRLRRTLPALAGDAREGEALAFMLDVLNEAGYLPDFESCGNCGGRLDERVSYSPVSSGLICRNCEQSFADRAPLDGRLLRILPTLIRLPRVQGRVERLPKLLPQQTRPLLDFLLQLIEQVIQKPLHTRPYLV